LKQEANESFLMDTAIGYSPAAQTLRNAGYKLTTPRLTLLDVLEQNGGHLTSTELLALVAERDASIGRASVFRTIDLLARLGIVASMVQDGSTINYVLMVGGHHHHMVCTNCRTVTEFEHCGMGALFERLEREYGFQHHGHLLEVYGICQNCRALVAM